jgi:hypothetical protein
MVDSGEDEDSHFTRSSITLRGRGRGGGAPVGRANIQSGSRPGNENVTGTGDEDTPMSTINRLLEQNQALINLLTRRLESESVVRPMVMTSRPEISVFSGNNFRQWMNEFDRLGELQGWSGTQKVIQAREFMNGAARIWYDYDITHDDSWNSFCRKAFDNFPETNKENPIKKYFLRKQQPGEDFRTFAHEKMNLLKKSSHTFHHIGVFGRTHNRDDR